MSRRLDQPTHAQLFFNQAAQYMAYAFIFLVLVTGIFFYTVHYSLQRDCTDLYHREVNVFGMHFVVDASKNKEGCPVAL